MTSARRDLRSRVAVITGASGDIGRPRAAAVVRKGMQVVREVRRADRLDLARGLRGYVIKRTGRAEVALRIGSA
jgi:NADP-dependent 3-hydroxy acid dehydrogenase YdfG